MHMIFNKDNTKKLIQASRPNEGMTLTRLNWLLENKDAFCGCLYKNWFNNVGFLVIKDNDEYKLICQTKKRVYIYLIADIIAFLKFICIEELCSSQPEILKKQLEEIKKLPSSGVVIIQNRKLFLYDFFAGGQN